MTTDITNFICIVRQKNGQVKIKHDINCEANIYKLLRDFGFRKSKLDNKRIYYRRLGNELSYVHPIEIKDAFHDFLERTDYTNKPSDVTHYDILEWYYSKLPIKANGLYDYILEDTLSEYEIHTLRMQTNHDYKHKFEINKLIAKFDDLHFTKTVDNLNSYSNNTSPLYYKRIGTIEYLVFNHWKFDSKNDDGFDCRIATYSNEKQIGMKRPVVLQTIKLEFCLERDFSLIHKYLDN